MYCVADLLEKVWRGFKHLLEAGAREHLAGPVGAPVSLSNDDSRSGDKARLCSALRGRRPDEFLR